MFSGIFRPYSCHIRPTIVQDDPTIMFRNWMGLLVVMSPIRWWSTISMISPLSMSLMVCFFSLWSTRMNRLGELFSRWYLATDPVIRP